MRAGANMVKIEGGAWLVDTVKMLTDRAVPVCGHLADAAVGQHLWRI